MDRELKAGLSSKMPTGYQKAAMFPEAYTDVGSRSEEPKELGDLTFIDLCKREGKAEAELPTC